MAVAAWLPRLDGFEEVQLLVDFQGIVVPTAEVPQFVGGADVV